MDESAIPSLIHSLRLIIDSFSSSHMVRARREHVTFTVSTSRVVAPPPMRDATVDNGCVACMCDGISLPSTYSTHHRLILIVPLTLSLMLAYLHHYLTSPSSLRGMLVRRALPKVDGARPKS